MELGKEFLPVSREDMRRRGWEQCDFVYVIGDAYIDHPSFGPAIISRVLESHGYRVGIISQPDWQDPASIDLLGEPRLGFLVSSGNMDTMVNKYTAAKKPRSRDAYTEGGDLGRRPDYAAVVYCNLIRRTYKRIPILVGGIEASLRRMGHYDYWKDKVKRSLLLDAQADLLLYGMGERSIVECADLLNAGVPVQDIRDVRGTVWHAKSLEGLTDFIPLPSFDKLTDKRVYAESFMVQYRNTDPFRAKRLVEPYSQWDYVVQNPPALPLSREELDAVYELPYTREPHPMYTRGVPAIQEIRFSLTSCRGCFGGCSFCALTFHQGRIIQSRSHESLLREAEMLTHHPDFKGYIHDVGGPTANFRRPACDKQMKYGACPDRQCLAPKPCPNLVVDHSDYIALLRKLRKVPGVKRVFIRSGVRFDYLLLDKSDAFLKELCKYHVSGQLGVAPEHVSDRVLRYMGKPPHRVYEQFVEKYRAENERIGKKQYCVPYLMSSHPGSTLEDAVQLAEYVHKWGYDPEQVQDFYPTPSTLATTMYYTGLDPRTMQPVYVPRSPREKAMQRALLQPRDPKNRALVREALQKVHRGDLLRKWGV